MPRLLNMSGAVIDVVYHIPDLPPLGMDRTATYYHMVPGGGFNIMAAAARTGMKVACGGQLGLGANGTLLRNAFAELGIEELQPPNKDLDSGSCVVIITADTERTFISWPGTDGFLKSENLERIVPNHKDWIFISGFTMSYSGSNQVLANWVSKLPNEGFLLFDPGPVVDLIPKTILELMFEKSKWISCNLHEAELMTGKNHPVDIGKTLLGEICTRADGLVLRVGSNGCYVILRGQNPVYISGYQVEAIDTNGAGDTHVGAFLSALSRGAHPADAADYANAAAAISVTRHGGSSGPSDQEISTFLSQNPKRNSTNFL